MKSGKERHWRDVLKQMTRGETDKLSVDAMLEYFEPLFIWLQDQNRGEQVIGWTTFKEDTSLFQPLIYGGSNMIVPYAPLAIFVIILDSVFFNYKYI